MRWFIFLLIIFFLTACSTSQEDPSAVDKEPEYSNIPYGAIVCPEEKAEACIEIFQPVCASDKKTYSNGCFACSEENVTYYFEDECTGDPDFFSAELSQEKAVALLMTEIGDYNFTLTDSYPGPKRCADCWTYEFEYTDNNITTELKVEHINGGVNLIS